MVVALQLMCANVMMDIIQRIVPLLFVFCSMIPTGKFVQLMVDVFPLIHVNVVRGTHLKIVVFQSVLEFIQEWKMKCHVLVMEDVSVQISVNVI